MPLLASSGATVQAHPAVYGERYVSSIPDKLERPSTLASAPEPNKRFLTPFLVRAQGAGAVFGGGAIAPGGPFTGYPAWWVADARMRRGHLIANSLGGPGGTDYRNLARIYFRTNNSGGDTGMRSFEIRAQQAALAGECIIAFVHPIFLGDGYEPVDCD